MRDPIGVSILAVLSLGFIASCFMAAKDQKRVNDHECYPNEHTTGYVTIIPTTSTHEPTKAYATTQR